MHIVPGKIYTLSELNQFGSKPTLNQLSYATITSLIIANRQYDFVFYPFSAKEGWVLIAIDGELPQSNSNP